MDLVLQQPGHHTCFLPTRSPACLVNVSKLLQLTRVAREKKKKIGARLPQSREERERGGGVETLWSDKAGGGRKAVGEEECSWDLHSACRRTKVQQPVGK